MVSAEDLCALIQKGGVFKDIAGTTVSEIISSAASCMKLPAGLDRELVKKELIERERILSTAVGNGIALPHPHRKLIDTDEGQRISVCFLKTPIDMQAPDGRKVYVYFILLTAASQKHIDILSGIANLAKNKDFLLLLERCPDEETLLAGIRKSMA